MSEDRDQSKWQRVHQRCVDVAKRAAAVDVEIGRALLAAARARVDRRLGYGSVIEYAERLFGFMPKVTVERLRVAEALEQLPLTDAALGDGRCCFSAVRELTRVALAETEAEWLTAAAGRTVREVEQLVAGHVPGDRPGEAARAEVRRHVLRFEVVADVYALFREAVGALRRTHGGQLDDEQALAMMARLALGGPADDGRAAHQIVVHVCKQCGQGEQQARGEPVAVSSDVVERAQCDAQRVEDGEARQDVPPATRRAVLLRDHGHCRVPGCRSAVYLDVHHIQLREEGGSHDPDNLMVACGAHHTALHRGALFVRGVASGALVFTHADGTVYGGPTEPALAARLSDAFLALKGLGWKEREARRAVDAIRPHVGASEPLEGVIRKCLAALTVRPPSITLAAGT